ncbi:mechanosensitive ion channel family protein [Methanomethylovorans sp.]|uniref:mechanosensitive ion channel family protein n=1 Tax=Methanomethylovorans sp. TaxID=2758717 RepID=UPI002FDD8E18
MSGRSNLFIIFLSALAGMLVYLINFTVYGADHRSILTQLLNIVLILLISYIVRIVLEDIIKKKARTTKERYNMRKISSAFITLIASGMLLVIFFKETTTLIVAYGVFSAGLVIALQDVFRNLAGGIMLLVTRPFNAGDRIQMGESFGDVLDITYFHTTLMEIQEWVDGDQYTGRIMNVPNSFLLSGTVKNYTRHFSFIWDEARISLIPGSNWKKAQKIIFETVDNLVSIAVMNAKVELLNLEQKYLLTTYDVETQTYIKTENDRIDIYVRYIVNPRQRRKLKNTIIQEIMQAFDAEEDITLGTISSIEVSDSLGTAAAKSKVTD